MSKKMRQDQGQQEISLLSVTRRQFLKQMGIVGGGIFVYFNVGNLDAWSLTKREGFLNAKIPTDFNAFLRVGTDGKISCFTGKIEMGQGAITSLPQMLAEELDVSYDAVNLVMGDTDLCPWDVGTFGSLSIRHFGIVLREAASEAKGVLKELAGDILKQPAIDLGTRDGFVYVKATPAQKVSYAQLTQGKIIEKHLDTPPLKPHTEYAIMGKSMLHQDARDKVTGKAKYAGDIRLPGMLYAAILRPPAHGAELKNLDLSGAKQMEDVLVIEDGDLIAVLHPFPDKAKKALAKIKAEYTTPETGLDHDTIFDHLQAVAPVGKTTSSAGDLETGRGMAAHSLEETYLNSYVAHAPMEPHTAVASFENGKCTVWASTQTPFSTRDRIAAVLNLKPEMVRMITPFVGGGFGGKGEPGNQAVEAARLAKIVGKPVQVAWSREEEFFYDTFRPAAIVKIKSGIDAGGKIVYWDNTVYFAGEGGSAPIYDIPHSRTVIRGEWRQNDPGSHPFAVGPWRAPANNTNTYAQELQIHMLAAKAGMDPLAFRLHNLKDQRMIGVLEAAAKQFGWGSTKSADGRGYGISCGIDTGTYVAHMAEVEVDKNTGKIKVKRVVCAQDMGFVVNPQGAKIQMEGCITMGLGYALAEEIHFKNGKIFDLNFDSYQLPRFSWLPEIETVLVDNKDLPPQGGGEPAIVGMGAVLACAVFDATGAKVLQLPMTSERVKKALATI